ncbi:MAG TPA: hypothetical protein VNL96_09770 [Gemmatimonadaceae bacterium]|nr:hypothetical protein [Gemmatimonadaceae bacterium]
MASVPLRRQPVALVQRYCAELEGEWKDRSCVGNVSCRIEQLAEGAACPIVSRWCTTRPRGYQRWRRAGAACESDALQYWCRPVSGQL